MVVWSDCPLENPPFVRGQPFGRSSSAHRRLTHLGANAFRRLCVDGSFRRSFLRHASVCIQGGLSLRPGGPYLRLRYPRVRHVHYFDYCPWDRSKIVAALEAETPWEIPKTAAHDWHSDCRLNVLREYMFQRMFGATATDAHLSNLIRCGMMTRDQGWRESIRTKVRQAAELSEVLAELGLRHLEPRLDPTCFDSAEAASGAL
jgi:hypothetical protein